MAIETHLNVCHQKGGDGLKSDSYCRLIMFGIIRKVKLTHKIESSSASLFAANCFWVSYMGPYAHCHGAPLVVNQPMFE